MDFTIATHNIKNTTDARVREYLGGPFQAPPRRGTPPISVAGFQEFIHGTGDFKHVMPRHWWIGSIFAPQPFAVNTRVWDILDMDGELAYDRSKVGKEGAGPSRLSERHVQWIDLKHRERPKARLRVFNTHAPPSIAVPLQPDGDVSRDELHETLMEANAQKIEETPFPVVSLGDFNCTWSHPNMRSMKQTGLVLANNVGQGTHGKGDPKGDRQIDLVLMRGGIPQDRRWQLEGIASGLLPKVVRHDHSGVWVRGRFVKTPGPVVPQATEHECPRCGLTHRGVIH